MAPPDHSLPIPPVRPFSFIDSNYIMNDECSNDDDSPSERGSLSIISLVLGWVSSRRTCENIYKYVYIPALHFPVADRLSLAERTQAHYGTTTGDARK